MLLNILRCPRPAPMSKNCPAPDIKGLESANGWEILDWTVVNLFGCTESGCSMWGLLFVACKLLAAEGCF